MTSKSGCFASENYVWGTWNRRLHLSISGDTQRALTTRESWTKLADKSWTCSPLWQNVVEMTHMGQSTACGILLRSYSSGERLGVRLMLEEALESGVTCDWIAGSQQRGHHED